jgi:hypothetical protein
MSRAQVLFLLIEMAITILQLTKIKSSQQPSNDQLSSELATPANIVAQVRHSFFENDSQEQSRLPFKDISTTNHQIFIGGYFLLSQVPIF